MVETEKRWESRESKIRLAQGSPLAQRESPIERLSRCRRRVIMPSVEVAAGLIAFFPVCLGPEAKVA